MHILDKVLIYESVLKILSVSHEWAENHFFFVVESN